MKQEVLQYRYVLWTMYLIYQAKVPYWKNITSRSDSMDPAQWKLSEVVTDKEKGPLFSNYVPGQAWLVTALKILTKIYDWGHSKLRIEVAILFQSRVWSSLMPKTHWKKQAWRESKSSGKNILRVSCCFWKVSNSTKQQQQQQEWSLGIIWNITPGVLLTFRPGAATGFHRREKWFGPVYTGKTFFLMVKPGGQNDPNRWSICPVAGFHEILARPNALPVMEQSDWLILATGLLQNKALPRDEEDLLSILFHKYAAK